MINNCLGQGVFQKLISFNSCWMGFIGLFWGGFGFGVGIGIGMIGNYIKMQCWLICAPYCFIVSVLKQRSSTFEFNGGMRIITSIEHHLCDLFSWCGTTFEATNVKNAAKILMLSLVGWLCVYASTYLMQGNLFSEWKSIWQRHKSFFLLRVNQFE